MRQTWGRAVLSAGLLTVSARAGWEYTAVTQAAGQHSDLLAQSVKTLVDGDRARIEFIASGNPMMPAGAYLLIQGAGKNMIMVHPQDKTYAVWDMSTMLGLAGGVMGMMNMQVQDSKVEKLLDEDGGKLLGYPTRHYRFRTSYTMSMGFLGMQQTTATVQEEELWVTKALAEVAFSFQALEQNMKSGNAQLDKLIAAQTSKAEGFPLKLISTRTTRDARGQEQVVKTTMEVTALKAAQPAAAAFQVPDGFQETEMRLPFGGGGKAGGAKQSGGALPGVKDILKELQKVAAPE